MNEIQFLADLSWPAAFTIVGSVIAIVGGLLALYSTYVKNNSNGTASKLKSQLPDPESVQIHARISELKDRVSNVEGQQRVFATQIDNLMKQINDHDARDVDDFKTINRKVDKLMEIIVEMLKADH